MDHLQISNPVLPIQQNPEALPVNFDGIPTSLKKLPQWLVWRWEKINGRWTKPPYQVNGRDYAKTNNSETWTTFEEVHLAYKDSRFDGIGLVIRGDMIGIDLDHVIHDGEIEPWAQEILDKFYGTYIEISPSGDGFHILTRGTIPRSGKFGPENRLEGYSKDSSRYFTVTGHMFGAGMEITEQQGAIDWMFETFDKRGEKSDRNQPDSLLPPKVVDANKQSSQAIVDRASNARNGEKFRRLFEDGDISGYASHSEADLGLATALSYWVDDAGQIDDIFRQSALYRPDKWDRSVSGTGKTYGAETIEKALKSDSAQAGANARAEFNERLGLVENKKSAKNRQFNGFTQAGEFIESGNDTAWLINGLIEQSSMTMLFGPSASGKSFVALDWAAHIAVGIDWDDRAVEQGAVFYICAEGVSGFRRRLKAWSEINDVSLRDIPLYIREVPAHLMDSDNVGELAEQIGTTSRQVGIAPKFIVIDTLARNFGGGDENSGRDVGQLVNHIDEYLKVNLGVAAMIVHHTGHSESGRARGSSALKAAMDQEYSVEKKGDRRILKCTKMKDGKDDFEFHFDIETHQFTDGGSAGYLVSLDVPSKQGRIVLSKKERTCLNVLRDLIEFSGQMPSEDVVEQEAETGVPERVCTKNQWQKHSIGKLLECNEFKESSKSDSHRRVFQQIMKKLINGGHVRCCGDDCWPVR
ncbi:phage NrS-1 polymerase family protein [Burkholderia anthina]|uniref:phage NrS-1 polymerase family protein n=1 Tax=Burkholderia anthina TaxID=179879 RepID=UPI0033428570